MIHLHPFTVFKVCCLLRFICKRNSSIRVSFVFCLFVSEIYLELAFQCARRGCVLSEGWITFKTIIGPKGFVLLQVLTFETRDNEEMKPNKIFVLSGKIQFLGPSKAGELCRCLNQLD